MALGRWWAAEWEMGRGLWGSEVLGVGFPHSEEVVVWRQESLV